MGRILIGNIKGPQGEAGKNFEYAKTYASVSAMNADFSGTDVAEGEYVVISAGIDDADNGRVYRKGTNSYVYVNRVNGPTGPRGATGPMPTLVTNLDTTTAGQGALDASVGPTIKGKVTKEGGETGDTVTTFNTSDTTTDAEIIEYTAMEKLTSGSPLKTLMSIMSKAVKNVRWFQKLLGTTDISGIGNGTVTNAVSTLNDALVNTTIQSYTPELVRTNGTTVIGQDTTGGSRTGRYIKIGNKVFVYATIKTRIIENGEYCGITLPYHAIMSKIPFTVAELTQNFQAEASHINVANVNSTLSIATIMGTTGTSAVRTAAMESGTYAYITFSGWYLTDQ